MRKKDLLFWILLPVPWLCAFGAWYLYRYGSPFHCLFRMTTGLTCPGCGSGRAARALLHLQFGKAFRLNPLFCILVLPMAVILIWEYLAAMFPLRIHSHPRVPQKIAAVLPWTVIVFWIGRNLPII